MATSYNGWPASPDKSAIDVESFGDAQGFPFPGGVKASDVATVLGYVATQLHYRVEPCVSGWCWGYTYKQNVNNPSQLSCHASGTAIDWNAPDHPNGSSGTFTNAQRGVIYAILDEVQGAVDWLENYDEMHFEIAVDATTLARVAASLGGTIPPDIPPTDWLDMATQDEVRQAFADALAGDQNLTEIRRMLGVVVGYPGAGGSPEQSVGQQFAGVLGNAQPAGPGSALETWGELRRMAGVAIGYDPAAGSPEHNLAQQP